MIDDDCVIPDGWFHNLLDWSARLPGQVVCGAGRVWSAGVPMHWRYGKRLHSCKVSTPSRTDIYIGSGTALFETRFFEDSVYPFVDPGFGEPGHSNWTGGDDIWFSAKLKSSVGIYVVPFDPSEGKSDHPAELDYASAPDCIWLSEKAIAFAGWHRALEYFAARFHVKAEPLTGC